MPRPPSRPPEDFVLTLRALPDVDNVPTAVRFRRVLKSLLRAYRFRCVDARPATSENTPRSDLP